MDVTLVKEIIQEAIEKIYMKKIFVLIKILIWIHIDILKLNII